MTHTQAFSPPTHLAQDICDELDGPQVKRLDCRRLDAHFDLQEGQVALHRDLRAHLGDPHLRRSADVAQQREDGDHLLGGRGE